MLSALGLKLSVRTKKLHWLMECLLFYRDKGLQIFSIGSNSSHNSLASTARHEPSAGASSLSLCVTKAALDVFPLRSQFVE
ncbi:MAG: hypothetical protein RLZZ117_2895 [Cyanobacteriota bacterium]|jgi:hypothetical protein